MKPGEIISLGNKAKEMALVLEALSLAEREVPDYVAPDGGDKITFVRVPTLDEVPYPVRMEPNLVVEFYFADLRPSGPMSGGVGDGRRRRLVGGQSRKLRTTGFCDSRA